MMTEGVKVEGLREPFLHRTGTVAFVFPRAPGDDPVAPRRVRVVFPGDLVLFRDLSEHDLRILP